MSERKAKAVRRAQREIIALAEKLRANGATPVDAAATAMANVLGVKKEEAENFIQRTVKK